MDTGFKSLKDHVYEYIASLIREGRLVAEEKINENQICSELNISRTPVREALIQLAAEEVLENRARKGFVVKKMDAKDIAELYEIIGVLDGLAAKKSLPHLTEKDFRDMDFYIETMNLAIKTSNYEMYYEQQNLFHQIYISKCNSAALIECIDKYKKKLLKKSYSDDSEGMIAAVLHETNQEHLKLLELFKEGDRDAVFRFLSEVHWRASNAEYDMI